MLLGTASLVGVEGEGFTEQDPHSTLWDPPSGRHLAPKDVGRLQR